ncbi:putative type II secretion system protein D precursor [Rubripirellula obstinata]|uniref:Putative type II secretion system protein D n=2 Tax=Rubripirellula obstinata TaxID=406547 RepID=A0A5B1CRK8_9BACT|nr:putative type II secretion system protein D precursor [Rubripirellula obstinata]
MEMIRQKANAATRFVAAFVVVTSMTAASYTPVSAQGNAVKLTNSESTVNKAISQSIERVQMLVKSSRILTLEDRIPKFQVHNETILGATPVSQNQIQIFAKAPGTTQLNLWDTNEKMYTVDVTVTADAREVEGILANQLPFASLQVLPVNSSAIISGTVTNVDDVDRAVAIVEQFYPTVVNNVQVVGVQQILLHTRIMEVSRTKLRELGIDWGAISTDGYLTSAPSALLDNNLTGIEDAAEGLFSFAGTGTAYTNELVTNDFFALINALRQQDLVKFLAEPTVVATHGRPARFNVGGKTPFIIPGQNGQVQVQFEEFGTSIDFLPFVVGPGRVRLEIRPEVSELNPALGIFTLGAQVPGFSTRYVETAVEMQAGQTFAIAGLLQSRTESQTRATPFFGSLPIVGSLFRDVVEERNDIELLITVTPELVAAMDPYEVPSGGPGLNSMSPTDHELYIKGHIEVPNMLGDGTGCTVNGGQSSCGPDGGCNTCNDAASGAVHHQPNYGGGVSYGNEMHGGTILPSSIPSGAIVPGNDPIVVGEGITITSPSN